MATKTPNEKPADKAPEKPHTPQPFEKVDRDIGGPPPPEERPPFPEDTRVDGHPPDTLPGRPPRVQVRTEAEEREAGRLSQAAADDPIGHQGKSLLACFDQQAIAKALGVSFGDADRLVDVFFVRKGKGDAEARAAALVKALARVSRGESVDDVLRELG